MFKSEVERDEDQQFSENCLEDNLSLNNTSEEEISDKHLMAADFEHYDGAVSDKEFSRRAEFERSAQVTNEIQEHEKEEHVNKVVEEFKMAHSGEISAETDDISPDVEELAKRVTDETSDFIGTKTDEISQAIHDEEVLESSELETNIEHNDEYLKTEENCIEEVFADVTVNATVNEVDYSESAREQVDDEKAIADEGISIDPVKGI